MKVLGLVVEYNPFHNGHLYHLEQSKKQTGADYTICVMSSSFVQRGEPAIVNKWARARMAICAGVDLVIELPVIYALSSAESFAFGAVKILDSLGIVDCICFGSENGSIEELKFIADIMLKEPEEYKKLLKSKLDAGLSFPKSRDLAIREYISWFFSQDEKWAKAKNISGIASLLSGSNNILAIEYLKALSRLNSKIVPYSIKRVGSLYNDEIITGSLSSATSIRKQIMKLTAAKNKTAYKSGNSPEELHFCENSELEYTMPKSTIDILKSEFEHGRGPVFAENYEDIIFALLRRLPLNEIRNTPYVSEGLENRIKSAADTAGTFSELMDNIVTKRYVSTRVQRIIFNLLAGISSEDCIEFDSNGGPQYVRILGFNDKGKELLSLISRTSSIPVIVKTADFIKLPDRQLQKRMLQIEALATDMYVLGYQNKKYRYSGQDFTNNVIYVKQ